MAIQVQDTDSKSAHYYAEVFHVFFVRNNDLLYTEYFSAEHYTSS